MNEEYPHHRPQDEGQEPDAERERARAPVTADSQPPAIELPPTGDDRVDAAVAGLRRLPGAPADEHVAVLEEVHGQLRDILGQLDEGQDRPIEPGIPKGRP